MLEVADGKQLSTNAPSSSPAPWGEHPSPCNPLPLPSRAFLYFLQGPGLAPGLGKVCHCFPSALPSASPLPSPHRPEKPGLKYTRAAEQVWPAGGTSGRVEQGRDQSRAIYPKFPVVLRVGHQGRTALTGSLLQRRPGLAQGSALPLPCGFLTSTQAPVNHSFIKALRISRWIEPSEA